MPTIRELLKGRIDELIEFIANDVWAKCSLTGGAVNRYDVARIKTTRAAMGESFYPWFLGELKCSNISFAETKKRAYGFEDEEIEAKFKRMVDRLLKVNL